MRVIIPTLNEAERIGACLAAVRGALPGARVVVVDGGSGDGTPRLAREAGADEVLACGGGRGAQCAAGAVGAREELLVFVHADARLGAGAARAIERAFGAGGAQCAKFALRYAERGVLWRVLERAARYDSWISSFGDEGIVIRRSFYEAIGGFRPIPLCEDICLFRRARRRTRVICLGATIEVSARRFERMGLWRAMARNAFVLVLFRAGVSPEALYYFYYGRAAPAARVVRRESAAW